MSTHREALDAASEAAAKARAFAIAAGHAPNSPEVERSAWLAADGVMRVMRPQDYGAAEAPAEPPEDPIFERMNR